MSWWLYIMKESSLWWSVNRHLCACFFHERFGWMQYKMMHDYCRLVSSIRFLQTAASWLVALIIPALILLGLWLDIYLLQLAWSYKRSVRSTAWTTTSYCLHHPLTCFTERGPHLRTSPWQATSIHFIFSTRQPSHHLLLPLPRMIIHFYPSSSSNPSVLDSHAFDDISSNQEIFSSLTHNSTLPTIILAKGSKIVAIHWLLGTSRKHMDQTMLSN